MASNENAKFIRDLSEFNQIYTPVSGVTLTKNNFSKPLHFYHLNQNTVKCCYHRTNRPCNKDHGRGFLVETIDGHVLAVGIDCGEEKLGLEHKDASDTLVKFKRSLEDRDKLEKYWKLSTQKGHFLKQADDVKKQIIKIRRLKDSFLQSVPDVVISALNSRSKLNDSSIFYEVQHQKVETGSLASDAERGNIERTWTKHFLGDMRGIQVFNRETPISIIREANKIIGEANKLSEKRPQTSVVNKVEQIANSLNYLKELESRANVYEKQWNSFNKPESMKILLFIVKNQQARNIIANLLCDKGLIPKKGRHGISIIAEFDNELKERHSASAIRIAA